MWGFLELPGGERSRETLLIALILSFVTVRGDQECSSFVARGVEVFSTTMIEQLFKFNSQSLATRDQN